MSCSLSADVFAGAETTLKERRAPEQKVGKCESLRAAVAVLQLFKSLLSLARPGQVQPADISEAFAVLVTMCFSRSLASTNARAGREVRPRTRAARRRRTRMQDGTHAWSQRTVRGDATTLASTNARAERQVRPRDDDEHACRTARTRGRSGLGDRGDATTTTRRECAGVAPGVAPAVFTNLRRGSCPRETRRRGGDDDATTTRRRRGPRCSPRGPHSRCSASCSPPRIGEDSGVRDDDAATSGEDRAVRIAVRIGAGTATRRRDDQHCGPGMRTRVRIAVRIEAVRIEAQTDDTTARCEEATTTRRRHGGVFGK